MPPKTPADLAGLWQVLAANCSGLEISWTDGAGDWFSRVNAQDANWQTVPFDETNPAQGEYQSAGRYRILWTRHDQNVWPRALRIRFTLDSAPYEVVYALP